MSPDRSPSPPLVVAAHGSADQRFAVVVEAIAERVRRLASHLDVRVGYLDHGTALADVVSAGSVIVPLFVATGHHVSVDIPALAPQAVVTDAVGCDPRLVAVLAARLREAGWSGQPVVLAAAGSTRQRALDDVRDAARRLAAALDVAVTAAFISAGSPRVTDLPAVSAISSYLLAPGGLHDVLLETGAPIVAAPIGDSPVVAQIALDRYLGASLGAAYGRTAPA